MHTPTHKTRLILLCLSILGGSVLGFASFGHAARVALVIGNSAYPTSPLANPGNDAQDIAEALTTFGFTVILKTDIGHREMVDAIQGFGQWVDNGDVALFYFSGHGLQAKGNNYLLPLQADITSEADVPFESVNANRVLAHLEQANPRGVNLMILDACRDNPYKSFMKSSGTGLAEMTSPAGSFIAYATAPGSVAFDDGRQRNSLYTKHLLAALQEMPGESVTDLFTSVRQRVVKETGWQQVPWEATSLTQRFCFGGCAPRQAATPDVSPLLAACERHFQANRLTTGRGGTALACYEQVLTLDPSNTEALAGLDRIEATYAEWAQQAFEQGDKTKARQYLDSLRLVNPDSIRAAALGAQLFRPTPTPVPATPLPTPTPHIIYITVTPTPVMIQPTPTTAPVQPVQSNPPAYQLRSTSKAVSSSYAKREFGLNDSRQPQTYVENHYEDRGEVVFDRATGLTWQQSGSDTYMGYAGAQAYVKELNRQHFAGYSDWRLPTIPELMSLLEPERSANGLYINPIFDKTQRWCWSADRLSDSGSSSVAWLVDFNFGLVRWDFLDDRYDVRAVRS